jgi:signal transduction histidine kinase
VIGTAYLRGGDYSKALAVLQKSLKIRESLGNAGETAATLSKIGVIYAQTGDYEEALSADLRVLDYYEKLKDLDHVGIVLGTIASLYSDLDQDDKANEYLLKVHAVAIKTNNKALMTKALEGTATLEENKGNYIGAVKALEKVAKLYEELGDKVNLAGILNNIGYLYRRNGDDLNGLKYYTKALKLSKEIGDRHGVALYTKNLGDVYSDLKQYDKAMAFFSEGLQMARESGIKPLIRMCYRSLAELYAVRGEHKKAYEFNDLFIQLNDSIINEEATQQVAEMQTKYETEKKENENRVLQQQNAISTLELENSNEKLKIRNQTIFILIAVMVIVLVIVFWQISLARIRKQKRELETEKKLQQDRERISRDLHDTVGGQLSYVLFSLEGKEGATIEERQARAAGLASAVRSVTGNLRETIWALNQEKLTLQDLSDKLKLYTRNMFAFTNVKVRFEEDVTHNEPLNPAAALNLYRICQEAVNNIFKHAKAGEVRIFISDREKNKVQVSDDGVGFLIGEAGDSTYGMASLKRRAEEIGGNLTIKSMPGKGTTIEVIV